MQDTVVVRWNNRSRHLVDTLDEYVTDDPSGTEDGCFLIVDHNTDGEAAVRGVTTVTIVYDGVTNATYVENAWAELKTEDLTPDQVEAFRRDGQRTQRRHPATASSNRFQRHRQEREENARLVGGRQRQRRRRQQTAPPEPVQQEEEFRIRWEEPDVWRTPSSSTPVQQIEDSFLWVTLIWVVRSKETLWEEAGETADRAVPALAACIWLRDRPLFRAMLQESIRRNLTFPDDVHAYFKQYVLDRSGTLDGYTPWRDPSQSQQAEELSAFLGEPVVPPEAVMNRELRSFSFEDNDDTTQPR